MSDPSSVREVIVLGGGAAGYFAAIACAEAESATRVTLLERTSGTLGKVKISGGGRCNVTHACFEPQQLVTFYPRGARELRGPFSRFQPRDTIQWFSERGVELKTEADGRIFPVTDSSQTIIDCLTGAAANAHVQVRQTVLVSTVVRHSGKTGFNVTLDSGECLTADRLIVATGSNPDGYRLAEGLGHHVEPPLPSLFTLNVPDKRLEDLAGLSVPNVRVRIQGTNVSQTGPVLVTHWGLSGPAILKLSAWGARVFHQQNYQTTLQVNWLPDVNVDVLRQDLYALRERLRLKKAPGEFSFGLPKRLWSRLTAVSGIVATMRWADVSNEHLRRLAAELQAGEYPVAGKSVFKEEFVTCGGVRLNEVDFRTMESKKCPGLYFAGEVLDIDGVTGGFNFQNAWTTGWFAGNSAAR
jgi:predicted Rossmann fold flavoprotein